MIHLIRKKLTLPADFIRCSSCLAGIEGLIASAGDFVDVTVDLEAGLTTIEYPAPAMEHVPLIALT
jgi:hypothetical protein